MSTNTTRPIRMHSMSLSAKHSSGKFEQLSTYITSNEFRPTRKGQRLRPILGAIDLGSHPSHERPPIRVHSSRRVGNVFGGYPDITVLVRDCRGIVAPPSHARSAEASIASNAIIGQSARCRNLDVSGAVHTINSCKRGAGEEGWAH